jgi:periplasmic protein TonB
VQGSGVKFAHAIVLSVALHAVLAVGFIYKKSNLTGLAKPPSSVVQGRVLTYQKPPAENIVAIKQVDAADNRVPTEQPNVTQQPDIKFKAVTAPVMPMDRQPTVGLAQSTTDTPPIPVVNPSSQQSPVPLAPQTPTLPALAVPAVPPWAVPESVRLTTTSASISSKEIVKDSASLDASLQLLSPVTLEYPVTAGDREGVVRLEITVGRDGKVENVIVVNAAPPGYFEAAAIAGFEKAQFTPGLFQGLSVKSRMLVEVEFMPTNRGGAVAGPK